MSPRPNWLKSGDTVFELGGEVRLGLLRASPVILMFVLCSARGFSGVKTSRALLGVTTRLFHCQVRSGSGCALLFRSPDCHGRRYVRASRSVISTSRFCAVSTLRSFNQPHEAVYRRRYGVNVARHQVSISKMREWERFLESTDSESECSVKTSHATHGKPRALEECIKKANALACQRCGTY